MRLIGLGLIAILLGSGCSFMPVRTVVLGGVTNIVDVPVGAKVCGISLPTDETNKTYCVVSTKPMRLLSMEAWNNLEKECK